MKAIFFFFYTILCHFPLFSKAQNRYDVVISEFLPDPSPSVSLPPGSFIELKNRSHTDCSLHNWKISNGSTTATIKSNTVLKADSFLILCSTSSVSGYQLFGTSLGISGFPALNNDVGVIMLYTEAGQCMHAVHYDKSWFSNILKAAGGWSLEMIDFSNPCSGFSNWTASRSGFGGTPGFANSVNALNPDEKAPSLVRAVTPDSLHVQLIFDEPMDSASVSNVSAYNFSNEVGTIDSATGQSPFFDRVNLRLNIPLIAGKTYMVTVHTISDCDGNEMGIHNICKTGISVSPQFNDIIFNELLFNPPSGGYDYIELYNRSSKIIDISHLYLANRNPDGSLKDPIMLISESLFFFPGEYLVLTEDANWILSQYPKADPLRIIELPVMPSLPDDQGEITLLDKEGNFIDEINYDHHWQSPLLSNENGVSLERIRAGGTTNSPANWCSAAASTGYGTPGFANSASLTTDSPTVKFISLDSKLFSPDMDGLEDYCFIHFHLPEAGFIGSITIFNINGILVRTLVNNEIWPVDGFYRWDGLDDSQNLLPMGHYIICAEVFRTNGEILKSKLVCTLAKGL